MKVFERNAFGWYVLTIQDKAKAELVEQWIEEGMKRNGLILPKNKKPVNKTSKEETKK